MRITVAGSEGFLGKTVCSLLEREGHQVVKLDIKQGFDLSDPKSIDRIPPTDCFIHLANLLYVPDSYKKPALFYRENYLTTLNALEVCRRDNAQMVYVSSYVYGAPQYLPVDEEHPISPFNPYAQTKVICEKICEGYNRDYGVPITILRPFNMYGVGQKGKLLIPEIVEQLKRGKREIKLKESSPRRDYINVIDVASAVCLCANHTDSYEIYNVCSGHSFSVLDITELINNHLKHRVSFVFSTSDRLNEVYETRGSYKKLESIGWKPTITFEQGIVDILNAEGL